MALPYRDMRVSISNAGVVQMSTSEGAFQVYTGNLYECNLEAYIRFRAQRTMERQIHRKHSRVRNVHSTSERHLLIRFRLLSLITSAASLHSS